MLAGLVPLDQLVPLIGEEGSHSGMDDRSIWFVQ